MSCGPLCRWAGGTYSPPGAGVASGAETGAGVAAGAAPITGTKPPIAGNVVGAAVVPALPGVSMRTTLLPTVVEPSEKTSVPR